VKNQKDIQTILIITVLSFIFLAVLSASLLAIETFEQDSGWKASPELVTRLMRQSPEINYDEQKVPEYTLPHPLVMIDGTTVTYAQIWMNERRPEILELFKTQVYGRSPIERPEDMSFNVFDLDQQALGGLATRKQVAVSFTNEQDGPKMDILIYLPNEKEKPIPTFVILNFVGNHAIHSDPEIKLSENWVHSSGEGVVSNRATEEARGTASSRFPVEEILNRGYGLATICYGDIDPDFDDNFKNGVHSSFDKVSEGKRPFDAWGSIEAWAWGLSRAMDYFEIDADIDHKRIIVLGHSRLGKTALWAGARDERFAIVISNNSGAGGAALSRRKYGETVEISNNSNSYWYCENYKKYIKKEEDLPIEQHMLIALIAPRPVYVASADQDLWSDPRGEYLSCKNADPVYKLLGEKGLEVDQMPSLDKPLKTGTIGYHIRSGKHNLTTYDWVQFMEFADLHLKSPSYE
jgi:hypothetical protein